VLEQLMTVELLKNAGPILERQRASARARRAAFATALSERLPWTFALPHGGLCLWADLGAPRSTALAAMADRYGVRLAAGPRFGVDGAFERFIRLPFSLPEPVLEDAAERLALAWHAVTERQAPTSVGAPALVA
jgi:DNA-binding transcriptional MocR family regulator